MSGTLTLFVLLCFIPVSSLSATADDLRSRIAIDGHAEDFTADEWVIDATTSLPEPPGDSRWGNNNDIRGLALTWDRYNLYLAVPATIVATRLMLFIDSTCGGETDLRTSSPFQRNIEFSGLTPNLIIDVGRVSGRPGIGYLDCNRALDILSTSRINAVYVEDGGEGLFEIALPWDVLGDFQTDSLGIELPVQGTHLRLVGAITGGPSTGAGDAAPDPTTVLEEDSTRVAVLDNFVDIPLDGDGDGKLDIGVSPRAVATFAFGQSTGQPPALPLRIVLERRVFAPDDGESLRFGVAPAPADAGRSVHLDAAVYSAAGVLVRHILTDVPRTLSDGGSAAWDEWDGRDDRGRLVPGGVYIIAVSARAGTGASKQAAKASCAVIR
jgi:hypothetical protein